VHCTVVIVNWNGDDHLPVCLESLRQQTFRDFEVLVVDNGSTDGSVDLVRTRFPEVALLSLEENLGFAAANNRAIARCRTPWIALLNNDTEADSRWLEALLTAAHDHPEASFFASQIRLFDRRDLLDSAGDGLPIAGAPFKIGHRQEARLYSEPRPVFGASAAAALYSAPMLTDLGGLDEDFYCIYEDADLSLRAQLAGHRCLYIPQAVVYHKVNSSLRLRARLAVFLSQRNSEWFILKNTPAPLLRKYRAQRILYRAVSLLYFAARGRLWTFLQAKRAAWRDRRRVAEKRMAVEKQTRVSDDYIESLMDRRWLRTRLAGKL
jgi:GT2 family glycosyltransferase